jgi:hypothetical protein
MRVCGRLSRRCTHLRFAGVVAVRVVRKGRSQSLNVVALGLKNAAITVDTVVRSFLRAEGAQDVASVAVTRITRGELAMGGKAHWVLVILPLLAGCQTHLNLRNNSLKTTATLADLQFQQVLENVARFTANPATMPAIAVFNAGTVTVSDQKTLNVNATGVPTLARSQQAGSGLPILSLLLNPSVSRTLTENWSMAPVTDMDNLRRIRCALQLLVLGGRETTDCDQCAKQLERFYLGEMDRTECLIPTGWYNIGRKHDVPKNACYVSHDHDVYAWVTPEGLEGLTRFTMTVLDLATGKPHAPTKTVVKTYKGDGSLDNTQVTTTEVDEAALAKLKRDGDRIRQYGNPPVVNPGYFFVPR